jgi:ubiquinone/menaquinone biosynthesis C-methylase UbiE
LTSRPWFQRDQFSASTSVLGIDFSSSVVELARTASTEWNARNGEFTARDAYNVDAEDGAFDVVHCHQCLTHLSDSVRALTEMKRVCKFGGTVAAGEGDVVAVHMYPELPGLVSGIRTIEALVKTGGGDPPSPIG